jgi:integrase
MTFHAVKRDDLPASSSPIRLLDEQGREIEWANRFLDIQRVRGLQDLSLSSYAYTLLHFVRWWSRRPGVDAMQFQAEQFTESTLVDYVRDQLNEQPKPAPENINRRAFLLRRLFHFYFHQDMPHAPYLLQSTWYRRSPLGYGRGRVASAPADLKLKVPQRVIMPLSVEHVARFWSSFRTARDLALVALMLLNGLRSREVLALQLEDLLFGEAQIPRTRQGIACTDAASSSGNPSDSTVLSEDRTSPHQCAGGIRLPERARSRQCPEAW